MKELSERQPEGGSEDGIVRNVTVTLLLHAVGSRPMSVRYRKHLILPILDQDEATGGWIARAHIEFTEKLMFHNVSMSRNSTFGTKVEAEKYIVHQAKEWIDKKLGTSVKQE